MASNVSIRRSNRSALRRSLALAAVFIAVLLAFMNSAARPGVGPMERSAFRGGAGYWMLAKDGGVFAFGDAKYYGPNRNQGNDIAGMAATATGNGYWTVDDDGDVFAYGDAVDYGSRPGAEIDDITGFAARSQGDGYWMVSKDGVVSAFGAAGFFGGANTLNLTKPIVGMAATPSGKGYWLIAGDGGVFSFGDAGFFGSTGSIKLNKPIVDFGPSPDGNGYRFIGNDGGVFSYGDAGFFGSTGSMKLNQPIVAFAATASGKGYWLVGQDGGVFAFGDAAFYGSMGGVTLKAPIVAIVATPRIKVAPTARDDSASVAEDGSVSIDVESNDTHLLPAAVSIDAAPAHGTASVSGTKVIYTPAANYNGPDSFTYKLTDTVGHTATAAVSVTVTAVNDAPIATGGPRTTAEDTALSGSLTASDVDAGDTLTYTKMSGPSFGSVSLNASTGAFTYTPNADYFGPDSFTFKATDNHGSASDVATVSMSVTSVNDLPTVSPINDLATLEDTQSSALSFTVGDVETAAASLTVVGSSSNQTLVPDANVVIGGSAANRTVTVTPAANQNGGPVTITVTVTDANSGVSTETFALTITSVNDVPTASNASPSTPEDTPLSASVTASDVDTGDTLTYSVESGVTHGVLALNTSTGAYTYTPNANYFGPDSFTFKVTDNHAAASNVATVSITVTSVNDLPTITDIANQTVNVDTTTGPLSVTVGDVETAAGSLTLSGSSSNTTLVPNANITFLGSGASRTVTVTPALGQTGTATITVTVTDGTSATASDSFLLTVNALPTISGIADLAVSEDTATGVIGFTVGDGETSAGGLTLQGSSSDQSVVADSGIVFGGTGANRTVTVTPVLNASGTSVITITVLDGSGGSRAEAFTLTVAVGDQPAANDDSADLVHATLLGIDVLANDSGLSNGPLSVTIESLDPTEATATVNVFTNTITLGVIDLDGDNLITFQYRVTDGDGDSAVGTVTVDLLS